MGDFECGDSADRMKVPLAEDADQSLDGDALFSAFPLKDARDSWQDWAALLNEILLEICLAFSLVRVLAIPPHIRLTRV